jgi:hypothetical protein
MAEQMWRVVAVFRVVTLAYAAVLIIRDHHSYAHPGAGFAALAVMGAWTAITVAAYARPRGRQPWLICADVAVAALMVLSTRLIDTGSRISAGAPTIPVSWAAASVLACAVASLASGTPADRPGDGLLDVGGLLGPLGNARVTVSCPAGAVLLADRAARALRYALEQGIG